MKKRLLAKGRTVGHYMMLGKLICLPLIFVSGIFIPLQDLPTWGKAIVRTTVPLPPAAERVRLRTAPLHGLGGSARRSPLCVIGSARVACSLLQAELI